jgi:uncharacterized protein (DUF1800 family)
MSKPTRTNILFVILALSLSCGIRILPAVAPASSSQVSHLLNRAAFGPRSGDVEKIRRSGWEDYVDRQLHPESIDDSSLEQRLSSIETWKMDAAALRARYTRDPRPVLEQLQAQKLIRAVYSERQLQEVMTDFWFNHFNVSWTKDGMTYLVTSYERDSIRPLVFGKFKDLLLATAKSPAMLVYLDNAWSAAPDVNENYARELMELHTMGVDGGYTQKDVVELARCLSGWTIDRDQPANAFVFNPKMHDSGDKVLLGHTIRDGGYSEGEAAIGILARHPATARFIASKLVRRLVADDPPVALVNRVTKIYIDTDGDLREMVRAIFLSEEISSSAAVGAKVKSPFEMVVSAMRAVNADVQPSVDQRVVIGNLRSLPPNSTELTKVGGAMVRVSPAVIITKTIEQMGQYLYQIQDPTGIPDRSNYWMGGWELMRRLNFEEDLVHNRILGTSVNVGQLNARFTGDPNSPDAWKTALRILNDTLGNTPVLDVTESPYSDLAMKTSAPLPPFVLALGSPEFQHK